MTTILAADIGATHARFAAFEHGPAGLAMGRCLWLDSAGAESFAGLLAALRRAEPALDPARADVLALAAPGPVRGGCFCDPPNLSWSIDVSDPGALGLGRVHPQTISRPRPGHAHQVMDAALPVLARGGPPGRAPRPVPCSGPARAWVMAPRARRRGGFVAQASEGGTPSPSWARRIRLPALPAGAQRATQLVGTCRSPARARRGSCLLSGEELAPAKWPRGWKATRAPSAAARFLAAGRNHVLQTGGPGGWCSAAGWRRAQPGPGGRSAFAGRIPGQRHPRRFLAAVPVPLNRRRT
jgi:glucokinase